MQTEKTPTTSPSIRALIYHASQVRDIARELDGGDPRAASLGAGPFAGQAESTVMQLAHQAQRLTLPTQLSYSSRVLGGEPQVFHALCRALLDGPGQVRVTVPNSFLTDHQECHYLAAFAAAGTGVRAAAGDLPAMALLGGTLAVLYEPASGLSVVREPVVVKALETALGNVWDGATAWSLLREIDLAALEYPEDGDGIIPRVLSMLCAGHTDAVAARELGCSIRTYRRHVADLMGRLNARSRFQAGARAGQLRITAAPTGSEPGTA